MSFCERVLKAFFTVILNFPNEVLEKFKQVALSGQMKIYKKSCLFYTIRLLKRNNFNTSRSNPGRREKIELNFYFHTSLCYLKRFYEGHTTFRNARDRKLLMQ